MRPRWLLLVVVACLIAPATARASGFFFAVPPLRADVGPMTVWNGDGMRSGGQLLLGVHWASMTPRDTPVDLGAGLVSSFVVDEAAPGPFMEQRDPSLYGAYLDIAARSAHGSHWRAWTGMRVELLHAEVDGRERVGLGAAARIAVEIFGGAVGGGAGGDGAFAAIGTAAIGVYTDVGYRDLPGVLGGVGVSSGVTVRVPLLFVAGS